MSRALQFLKALLISDMLLKWTTLLIIAASALIYYLQFSTLTKQLSTAKEQENTQLRAYVGPSANDIRTTNSSLRFRVTVNVKNFGQTPAYNVSVSSIYDVQYPRSDGRAPIENPDIQKAGQEIVLYPSDVFGSFIDEEIKSDDLADVKAGKKVLVYQAKIYYTDIFNEDQWSTLCYTYNSDDFKSIIEGKPDADNQPATASGTSCSSGFDAS